MTELRKPREVDMVPEELRFVPQVKSDIIIQRRNVKLAPIEAANEYTRNGTNTITFNVQGHRELSQLLDTKSLYFTWHCKFKNAYPVEDVSMLIEEVIISSNGRTLERIRHAQYIQHFIRGYGLSRESKARLGQRCGFQKYEDRTIQLYRNSEIANPGAQSKYGYGHRRAAQTGTAHFHDANPAPGGGAAANANAAREVLALKLGETGYNDYVDQNADAHSWKHFTRMSQNIGYVQKQIARQAAGVNAGAQWGTNSSYPAVEADGSYHLMKFRLPCSGLLSSEKMLPIGWMPLTIQLRLSDKARATDSGIVDGAGNLLRRFDYTIMRPRLHMNVCSVGQAYASAMQQRLRGPGITLNCKMFDTYFQIISNDKQIVIPSNKQRLSKVWVMFHEHEADVKENKNAFRSSVTGGSITSMYTGRPVGVVGPPANAGLFPLFDSLSNKGGNCLQSYQFQVGTEVSEAVTLETASGNLVPGANNVNTGMAYLEAYLRAIGAVNGHEQEVEFWGRKLNGLCNDHEGGDLLQTFLAKYFVAVYDGEKLLGSNLETGVDTESGKDIVVDLRWAGNGPVDGNAGSKTRVQVLIQYHAQVVIKENDVSLSY